MLLVIDIGNTQTVVGLMDDDHLVTHWRLVSDSETTSDELFLKLATLLQLGGFTSADVSHATLSSVVPPLTELWDTVSRKICGESALHASIATVPWLQIAYDNPDEIGADRIADAVAAIELYGSPSVVVDLGTATNIEVIDRDGRFAGGIIAPGLVTSTNALFESAARIPRFDIVEPLAVIGKSTREAVRSGLLYGEVDKVDGLVRRVWKELGYQTIAIATGGLANVIGDLSTTITVIDRNLTLKGLQIINRRNCR